MYGKRKPTVRSYGSCAVRGITDYTRNIVLKSNIGFNSLLTATAPRTPEHIDVRGSLAPWEIKMVQLDLEKNAFQYCRDNPTEYCVIDLIDERYDLLKIEGSYILNTAQIKNGKCIESFKNYNMQIIHQKDLDQTFWEAQLNAFCTEIEKIYSHKKIILVECYMVYEYIDTDGQVKRFNEIDYINSFNTYAKKYYEYLKRRLDGCHIINMPSDTIGDAKHRWGKSPVHYTTDFYKKLAEKIEDYVLAQEEYCRGIKARVCKPSELSSKISKQDCEQYKIPEYIARHWNSYLGMHSLKGKRVLQKEKGYCKLDFRYYPKKL